METETIINNSDVYIQSINYCIIFIVLDIIIIIIGGVGLSP
jgi:hypothetical protein